MKKKTVVISGYFNPIHSGHIDYIKNASLLGDKLIVIVNNDLQVSLKKSIPFQNEKERSYIVSSIVGVDGVVISIDIDITVCETLKKIRPDIFANGGDRTFKNIPEKHICHELGIEVIYGVGGNKTQSSSELIKRSSDKVKQRKQKNRK